MDSAKGLHKWEYYLDNMDKCCIATIEHDRHTVESPRLRRDLLPSFEMVAHASTKSLPGRCAAVIKRKNRAESKSKKLAKSQDIESMDVMNFNDPAATKQQRVHRKEKAYKPVEANPPRPKLVVKTSKLKENSSANQRLLTAIAAKVDRSILLDCDFLANLTGKSQLQGSTVKTSKNRVKNKSGFFDGILSQRICADLTALQSKGKNAKLADKRYVKTTYSKPISLIKTAEVVKSGEQLTHAKISKPSSQSIMKLIKTNRQARFNLRDSKLSLTDASHTLAYQQDPLQSTVAKSSLQIQINKKLKSLTQQLFEKYSPKRSQEAAKRCRSTGQGKRPRTKADTPKCIHHVQGRSTGKVDRAFLKRSFCHMPGMLEKDYDDGRSTCLLKSMIDPSTAARDTLQKVKHRPKLMSYTNLN